MILSILGEYSECRVSPITTLISPAFLRPPLLEGLFLSANLMGRYTTEEALLAADSLRIEIEQSADSNT